MIPMPIEHSQCQQNALNDLNVSRTTQLRQASFIEYIVYLRFETSQSWRPLLQNVEQRTNHIKKQYKALKELEKRAPHKDVASKCCWKRVCI